MKRNRVKKKSNHNQLRQQITKLAARLMYEEDVGQYFDAKRIAARRLLKQGGKGKVWFKDLPSNGEISTELNVLADLHEGEQRKEILFAMRVIALDIMESLSPFNPRLIGSVSTGRIRAGSDIDIHVFTDDIELMTNHIHSLSWSFETEQVPIQLNGAIEVFTHIYVENFFPIELSVYPSAQMRVQGKSSTDGKPIIRLKPQALRDLIMSEHIEPWLYYLQTGEILGLDYDRGEQA